MIRLLVRRAGASWPLLAAVVAVVAIGATLLGVSARLLTVSTDSALSVGMSRVQPEDAEVVAYLSDIAPGNGAKATAITEGLLDDALSPLGPPTLQTRASSTMRNLEGHGSQPQVGYLSGLGDLSKVARLVDGTWPEESKSPVQTVVLESTAKALKLKPGSHVHLGKQVAPGARDSVESLDLLVTGVVAPLAHAGWDRDPLQAAGFQGSLQLGFPYPLRGYGPFLVDLPTLWGTGLMLDRLQVDADPDLNLSSGHLNRNDLYAVQERTSTADGRLDAALGDLVKNERVGSSLPFTLARAHTQEAVTRSTVLIVVLLGTLLTAAALALAGRLEIRSRTTQTALFSALGASRAQLIALATAEALGLALIAAVIAVPASSFGHSALTQLPALSDAGLATGPGVNWAQVLVLLAGALGLTTVLLLPAVQTDPAALPSGREGPGVLVRSGADLALLVLAGVGWWQLRVQPAAESGVDLVRILAPGLFLLAGAALMVRLTALPLRLADRLGRRSTRLMLPLAAFEAARRPQTVAAALLLVLASAAGTFGLAFAATWQQSQADQADLTVGTDLAVTLAGSVQAGQGESLAAATGGTVSRVLQQNVPVGQYLGGAGDAPRLVALNTRDAGTLLRGRLPDALTWGQVGAQLTPKETVAGVRPAAGGELALTAQGSSSEGPPLQAIPRLTIEDADGVPTFCDLPTLDLDGKEHAVRGCGPLPTGARVVMAVFVLQLDPATAPPRGEVTGTATADLTVRFPGAGPDVGEWTPVSLNQTSGARIAWVKGGGRQAGTDAVLNVSAQLPLNDLSYVTAEIGLTGFDPPGAIPVAVSQQFADVLGARPGKQLDVQVGAATVQVQVASVVPTVPSAPAQATMLADIGTLSRALIAQDDWTTLGNAWWVGHPQHPDAAAKAQDLGLGVVTTRDEVYQQSRRGPLRVGLPAALIMLIPATLLLALGGLIMHVVSDLRVRAMEVTRLRALGLSRGTVTGLLLAQHGGLLGLLLIAGAAVGALATVLVGPLLIRSDLGAEPVPAALAEWPWTNELLLIGGLLGAALIVIGVVSRIQVRSGDVRARRAAR
jgi:hypothetical protein